jgi:predicted amidohydrolase
MLKLALVQRASSLDPAENRDALGVVDDLDPDIDLVVFPEVFMRDFGKPGSLVGEFAEPLDGPFVERLTGLAKANEVTIVAGMFERSEDPDRPDYRKIHLYDSFGYKESESLLAGPIEPVLVDVGGLSIGLMTCYDLRFPELARELTKRGAELVLVPAAWVAGPGKVEHWRTLAKARAIENTVFVAAVGQPGPRYTGHSLVVGPDGELLAEIGDGELVATARVATDLLDKVRANNPSLANRRF